MCDDLRLVRLRLSRTPPRWEWRHVDACISDLVRALQDVGMDIEWSCCGHGEGIPAVGLRSGGVITWDRNTPPSQADTGPDETGGISPMFADHRACHARRFADDAGPPWGPPYR